MALFVNIKEEPAASHASENGESGDVCRTSREQINENSSQSEHSDQAGDYVHECSALNSRDILSKLNELRLSSTLCDCVLLVDGHTLPAHRVVLAATSSRFLTLYDRSVTSPAFIMEDVALEDIVEFLEFIYTGHVTLTDQSVGRIRQIAEDLGTELLLEECDSFFARGRKKGPRSGCTGGSSQICFTAAELESIGVTLDTLHEPLADADADLGQSVRNGEACGEVDDRDRRTVKDDIDHELNQATTSGDSSSSRSEIVRNSVRLGQPDASKMNSQLSAAKRSRQETAGKGPSFPCPACGFVFSRRSNLKRHMSKHESTFQHPCNECGKIFRDNYELLEHVNVIHAGKRLLCQHCGKSFTTKTGLKLHVNTHQGIFKLTCADCGLGFQSRKEYEGHRSRHTGVKRFDCVKCHMKFAWSSSLKKHKRICGVIARKHECDICHKMFKGEANLLRHSKFHKDTEKYPCLACGKVFAFPQTLSSHVKRTH